MFYKVHDIIRADAVLGFARRSIAYAYRSGVRPYLPSTPVHCAGIPICHDGKWGDRIVPVSWVPYDAVLDQPDYEATLVASLSETIRAGDSVVVVGGGLGVTVVVAALLTGASGSVQCFEGSKKCVGLVQQTIARNRVTNVSVHHAAVAKATAVWGSGDDVGPIMPPSKLPPCNVLELDCEGAEVEILRELTIQPRAILVETHSLFGAPTDLVASLLEKHGYVVSDRGLAETRGTWGEFCAKKRYSRASRNQQQHRELSFRATCAIQI